MECKKLNLGCFKDIKKGYINLDKKVYVKGTDVTHDLDKFPYPFEDNTFEEVLMNCVFEHINYHRKTLEELYRICKNKAIIKIKVPFESRWVRKLEHTRGFNHETFESLCSPKHFNEYKFNFKLIKIHLEPTSIGRLIPQIRLPFMRSSLRGFVSYFLNNIVKDLYVEMEVVK